MSDTNESFALEFEKPIIEMEEKLAELENFSEERQLDLSGEIERLKNALHKKTKQIFDNLTPWERVQIARHPKRPETIDYIEGIADNFIELHGDRSFRDDRSILTGMGMIKDHKVMFIGQQKGKNLSQRTAFNFGCPHPEGYRKALSKMKLAEKFGIPIVTFINTPGAYPGIEAEERGQFHAIAENIMKMADLETVIISVIIGEGGSGGALGIGVADRIAILENSYYSVISPEGCAAILWKNAAKKSDAAAALKLTGPDLKELNIIDTIIHEPLGGAHKNHEEMIQNMKDYLSTTIHELSHLSKDQLLEERYEKYRSIGFFRE